MMTTTTWTEEEADDDGPSPRTGTTTTGGSFPAAPVEEDAARGGRPTASGSGSGAAKTGVGGAGASAPSPSRQPSSSSLSVRRRRPIIATAAPLCKLLLPVIIAFFIATTTTVTTNIVVVVVEAHGVGQHRVYVRRDGGVDYPRDHPLEKHRRIHRQRRRARIVAEVSEDDAGGADRARTANTAAVGLDLEGQTSERWGGDLRRRPRRRMARGVVVDDPSASTAGLDEDEEDDDDWGSIEIWSVDGGPAAPSERYEEGTEPSSAPSSRTPSSSSSSDDYFNDTFASGGSGDDGSEGGGDEDEDEDKDAGPIVSIGPLIPPDPDGGITIDASSPSAWNDDEFSLDDDDDIDGGGSAGDGDDDIVFDPSTTTAGVAPLYSPMRIRAILTSHQTSGGSYLTKYQRRTLLEEVIRPALRAWSRALLVVPIGGNLTMDGNQLEDGEDGRYHCGGVAVPPDDLEYGVTDADLVVYVSVGFRDDVDDDDDEEGPDGDVESSASASASSGDDEATTTSGTSKWVHHHAVIVPGEEEAGASSSSSAEDGGGEGDGRGDDDDDDDDFAADDDDVSAAGAAGTQQQDQTIQYQGGSVAPPPEMEGGDDDDDGVGVGGDRPPVADGTTVNNVTTGGGTDDASHVEVEEGIEVEEEEEEEAAEEEEVEEDAAIIVESVQELHNPPPPPSPPMTPPVSADEAPAVVPTMAPTTSSPSPGASPSVDEVDVGGGNGGSKDDDARRTRRRPRCHRGSHPPTTPGDGEGDHPEDEDDDVLASATYCATDQYDRPIAGSVHYCLSRRDFPFLFPVRRRQNGVDGDGNDDDGDEGEADDVDIRDGKRLRTTLDRAVSVTMHELGHVLGFNPLSLAHFRHPTDGTPRTPRDDAGNVPDVLVDCAGEIPASYARDGDGGARDAGGASIVRAVVALPSEDTLVFRTSGRGGSSPPPPRRPSTDRDDNRTADDDAEWRRDDEGWDDGDHPVVDEGGASDDDVVIRVAEVVTPTVAQVVRNHFDCQSLEGAELEIPPRRRTRSSIGRRGNGTAAIATATSAATNATSFTDHDDSLLVSTASECIGTHWSRRLFNSDLMDPLVEEGVPLTYRMSALTLAFLLDSGWYRVDPTRISHVSEWGRGAGCSFVTSPCIVAENPDDDDDDRTQPLVPPANRPFFCSRKLTPYDVHGCTSDIRGKAVCSLVDHGNGRGVGGTTGGKEAMQPTDDGVEEVEVEVDAINPIPTPFRYFAGSYGPSWGGTDADMEYCPYYRGFGNGLCTDPSSAEFMTFHEMEEFRSNSRCVLGTVSRHSTALCLPIACVLSDHSLRVRVEGTWRKCNHAGQRLRLWWDDRDYVECPDPWRICPTFFCPRNCLGTMGTCDHGSGECLCEDDLMGGGGYARNGTVNTTNSTSDPSSMRRRRCSSPDEWKWRNGTGRDGAAFAVNEGERIMKTLDVSLVSYYVTTSDELTDERRSITERTHRLFARMTSGQVVAFAIGASLVSFLFVVGCWMMYRNRRRGGSDGRGRSPFATAGRDEDEHRRSKHKVFAAMLLRLRLDDAAVDGGDNAVRPRGSSHANSGGRNVRLLRRKGMRTQNRISKPAGRRGQNVADPPLDVVLEHDVDDGDSSATHGSVTMLGSTDSEACSSESAPSLVESE